VDYHQDIDPIDDQLYHDQDFDEMDVDITWTSESEQTNKTHGNDTSSSVIDQGLDPMEEADRDEDSESEPEIITDDDIVILLQEQYGDDWREQLHVLHMCYQYSQVPIVKNSLGGSELTSDDLDTISAFALRMEGSGLPRLTYLNLHRFFQHKLSLGSEYLMHRRIETLSGVKPIFYDMCTKSCCLFVGLFSSQSHTYEMHTKSCCLCVGSFSNHTQCLFCQEPRYNGNNKPVAQLAYLPLIPRIQAWFESPTMIARLKYRSQHVYAPDGYSDVFDGSHYRSLQECNVHVNGEKLNHKYFSDPRDLAFGGSTDGFQVCYTVNLTF
jgi:hypothetical protein